jgi:hypothetical protein
MALTQTFTVDSPLHKRKKNYDGVEVDVRGVIHCEKNKIPAFPRRIDSSSLLFKDERVLALLKFRLRAATLFHELKTVIMARATI